MLNVDELRRGLAGFYGTEQYHRLTIIPGLVGTDGVAYLAKNAECFWLIDEIAIAQRLPKIRKNERLQRMQFWKLEVKDSKAVLTCRADSNVLPAFIKRIDYTDFPLPEIEIWVAPADETTMVAMLKTEY